MDQAETNSAVVEELKNLTRTRTETDVLLERGVNVTFGSQRYHIKHAKYKQTIEWVEKVSERMAESIVPKLNANYMSDPGGAIAGLIKMIGTIPEDLIWALKEYDPSLPWGSIEEEVYTDQIGKAFEEVVFNLVIPVNFKKVATLATMMTSGGQSIPSSPPSSSASQSGD